ncbi:MAG: GGDEF domain-containing protein [Chloroflexota bacterium]
MKTEIQKSAKSTTATRPPTKSRRASIGVMQRAAAKDHAAAARDHATAVRDHTAAARDQVAAGADQSAADVDQTLSDSDQTGSTTDQMGANRDQRASDRDQATADRDHKAGHGLTAADESDYDHSREERHSGTFERLHAGIKRSTTAHERDATADRRDRVAATRDEVGIARDVRTTELGRIAAAPEADLTKQLEELAAKAAADRARAAADRARAAKDRAEAAVERARLEAELRSAHLDELTGAYRREMGRLALANEITRARRSDGQFVLAFVDVDRLKEVNDRDGHAAGDRVLQKVVHTIRGRLRSFDPIIRYGGDEFVCGLSGTDMDEAERRFEAIGAVLQADADVGISVGFAALSIGDTPEELTERADAAMLEVKALHHSRA